MTDPIEQLFETIIETIQSYAQVPEELATAVCNAIAAKSELIEVLKTDRRMVQINQGNASSYQVLVEDGVAYIGTHYQIDGNTLKSLLEVVLRRVFQPPVGIPQNLPRGGVRKFVGRDRELATLHEQLQQNDRLAIASVQGMGGIGKTELALQYAISNLAHSNYPAGLCWLRARDREIATQIVKFANVNIGLTIDEQLEIDAQVAFCWQHWPQGEVLIILDDVTDYQAIAPYLPPSDPRFKLLITTRVDLGSTVLKVVIEELDEDSAIALLESLIGEERIQFQLDDAQSLCRWVGYLPLALELLGRFLVRKLDWSIDRLLKALKEKSLETKALTAIEAGMTGQLGVAAALELSWQELNQSERDLACILGLFAIAPIPWSLVEQCLSSFEADDLEELRDNGLKAHSLLKRVGENSYQLHQIVQEYFRIKLQQYSASGEWIRISFCQEIVKIAKNIKKRYTIDELNYFAGVIPHIEEVANYHIDILKNNELIHPFEGIGNFYRSTGNYILAEYWYGDCLNKVQIRLGNEHLDVATSLSNLANLYRVRGKVKEAELLLKEALRQREILLGEEHPSFINSLSNLAILYRTQGRYKEANVLYHKILENKKKLLGEDHLDIASSLNNIAIIYCIQGKYDLAELLYKEALEKRQRLLGEDHISVINILSNLANLYRAQGKYEQAEPLLISTLEKKQQLFGEDNPFIINSLSNLANLYRAQGKYEQAQPLLIDILTRRQSLFGEEHHLVARSMNYLAILYSDRGMLPEAELLCTGALEQRKRILGLKHPSVARSQWTLGTIYQKQDKYVEAKALYNQALEIYESEFDFDHPDIQGIKESISSLPPIYQ
jgi:tetratricopeptide (TPR) repeat protein